MRMEPALAFGDIYLPELSGPIVDILKQVSVNIPQVRFIKPSSRHTFRNPLLHEQALLLRKKLGITENTYYRWRREYGGLRVDQAKKLKELERENAKLKRLVADLSLDKAILKEAAEGNF